MSLDSKMTQWGNQFKMWREKNKEKRLQNLDYKQRVLEKELRNQSLKTRIAGLHMQRQSQNLALQERRSKVMHSMPSLFSSGPSSFDPFAPQKTKVVYRYRTKKRR